MRLNCNYTNNVGQRRREADYGILGDIKSVSVEAQHFVVL
jgi:hypothetical protein